MRNYLLFILSIFFPDLILAQKIPITTDMVLPLTLVAREFPGWMPLFDGNTQTNVSIAMGKPEKVLPPYNVMLSKTIEIKGAVCIIDMKGLVKLSKIRLYDTNGSPTLNIYGAIDPFKPFKTLQIELSDLNKWREFEVKQEVRYLILNMEHDPPYGIGELEVHGEYKTRTPERSIAKTNYKPVEEIIGVNSHNFGKLKNFDRAFNHVRLYTYWDWHESKDKEGIFAWSRPFGPSHDDAYFQEAKAGGIRVLTAFTNSPAYIVNTYPEKMRSTVNIPVRYSSKGFEAKGDPLAYNELARLGWQFAARYGKEKHSPSKLQVEDGSRSGNWWKNQPLSGLNTVECVEFGNEFDKDWMGLKEWQSPFECAAMMSAVYDGHEGALGKSFGVKNADASMKVSMPGLAHANPNYIKLMKLWFDHNRKDKRFCVDIINVHHYSNLRGSQYSGNGHGVSPERDDLYGKLRAFLSTSKQCAPEAEVVISEFGYDTNESPQRAPSIGSMSNEEVQSAWIIRSYLEIIKAGYDVAYIYHIRDDPARTPTGLYGHSGLLYTGEKENNDYVYTPKRSYHALKELKEKLTGYTFSEDLSNEQVRIYQFMKGQQGILVVWLPTEEDKKAQINIFGKEILVTETPQYIIR